MAKRQEKSTKKKYSPADSLKQGKSPKVRKEFIDYDYTKTLDSEALEFLGKFNSEYYGASIRKTKSGKIRAEHVHKDLAHAKESYDDNNRRNNDVMGVTRANALLFDLQTEIEKNDGWYSHNPENQEDALIADIDSDEDTILSFKEYQEVKHNLTIEMQFYYESIYGDYTDED